ncbi:MAG: endonuclease III, partial [bacterium]
RKYRSAEDYARADTAELERDVRPTGFYRSKAAKLKACCGQLMREHGGGVPGTMEELTKLAGVGRKTANIVLGCAFGVPGIAVDTHVSRVSRRLGITSNSAPDKIEADLMKLAPVERWTKFSLQLVEHGREVCGARKPECGRCGLTASCDYYEKLSAAP